MKYTSNSEEETQNIADNFVSKLLPNIESAVVVGLYGNLGAGKTAFTKCIAKSFGIENTVNSPTFVIEKIYKIADSGQHSVSRFEHLIHIDAYRLEKSSELLHLGWNEVISDPKNLVVIEWPENVADIMPKHIKISIEPLESEGSREIEISGIIGL